MGKLPYFDPDTKPLNWYEKYVPQLTRTWNARSANSKLSDPPALA